MILTLVFSFLLASSVGLNAFLFFKSKNEKKDRKESLELSEFLHDLLSGNALIHVQRIAPADIILRSPRQK